MTYIELKEKDFILLLENYFRNLNPGLEIKVELYIKIDRVGLYEHIVKKCTVRVTSTRKINVNNKIVKQNKIEEISDEKLKEILGSILNEEVCNIKFGITTGGYFEDYDRVYKVTINLSKDSKLKLRM